MRRRNVVILLLIAIIGIYGAFMAWRMGWIASLPLLGPSPKIEAVQDKPIQPLQPDRIESKAARPSFDVVRAEPSGDVFMAGRAEPGWTVSVDSGNTHVGNAVANENGEWLLQPSKPLSRGEHSLTLKAQPAEGGRTLFSKQRLMLSLDPVTENQPLVALTEEGKPTRVLQMSPGSGSTNAADLGAIAKLLERKVPSSKQVTFASIDYEDVGEKSVVRINGYAEPGMSISLYIDNEHVGTATADASGMWSFAANRELADGNHAMRADALETPSGKVVTRAEVTFNREPPKPDVAVAEGPQTLRPFGADGAPASAGEADEQAASGTGPLQGQTHKGRRTETVIIKRGDTLWHIAERHYGSGEQYTQIFQNNKGQIRDPDLIYPNQEFVLPK
jgi:nucleoid-associated protein YgaU